MNIYSIPKAAFPTWISPVWVGSYVISGIGFLGAGIIVKDGIRIRGLTTAAGLWVVACLGIAVGAGFYLGAFLVILILILLKITEDRFMHKNDRLEISLQIRNIPCQMATVLNVTFTQKTGQIKKSEILI